MQLDARDMQILRVLSSEGRITKAALAERIGLSPTPCWERLKKLEEAGIIDSYRAQIDLRKLGPHVRVFVTVELEDHTSASFRRFEAHIKGCDAVTGCWALGGGFDYVLQILARDIEAYQQVMDDLLEAGVGVARYFTYVVTKPVKEGGVPPLDMLRGGAEEPPV